MGVVGFVQHLEAEVAHGVRALRDGRVDDAGFDEREGVRVDVHGNQGAVREMVALEGFGDGFAALGFKTDESIDFLGAGAASVLQGAIQRGVVAGAGVDDSSDPDAGVVGEKLLVTLEALFEVGLVGDGEEDDVALAAQSADKATSTNAASFDVVRANEEQTAAEGAVRVDGDHRNACGHGLINHWLEQWAVRGGDKNARRTGGDGVAECGDLCLRVVALRAGYPGGNAVLGGGILEAILGCLPVGKLAVHGDEIVSVLLIAIVAAGEARAGKKGERAESEAKSRTHGWLLCKAGAGAGAVRNRKNQGPDVGRTLRLWIIGCEGVAREKARTGVRAFSHGGRGGGRV